MGLLSQKVKYPKDSQLLVLSLEFQVCFVSKTLYFWQQMVGMKTYEIHWQQTISPVLNKLVLKLLQYVSIKINFPGLEGTTI